MKILHVLNMNRFSGAENVVCQIIGMFSGDSDIQMIYCSPDGPVREALEERNVVFFPLQTLSVSELRRAIKSVKPDIIHAHDMRASCIAALACGSLPVIAHIHNNDFASRKLTLKSFAFLAASVRLKHIFWVSKSAAEGYSFRKIIKKKSSVLNNIIDIDALNRRAEADKESYAYDVIFLGRFEPVKNPLRVLEICRLVKEKRPGVKFVLVGTGSLASELESKAREMQLEDSISFTGFRNNPSKILSSSKLMILTSLWEGVPMCALEAAAFGVPVVSTPVDGLLELIENDVNGYLSDDNAILAEKINEYLGDGAKLNAMSQNQKTKAGEWNDKAKYKGALLREYTKH